MSQIHSVVDHEVSKNSGDASRDSHLTMHQNHSTICVGIPDKSRDLFEIGIHSLKRPVSDINGQEAVDGKSPRGGYIPESGFSGDLQYVCDSLFPDCYCVVGWFVSAEEQPGQDFVNCCVYCHIVTWISRECL